MTIHLLRKLLLALIIGALSVSSALARDAVPQRHDHAKKSAPVRHPAKVKACAQYGDGFVQIAGTETCVKVGGFIRMEGGVNVER